MRLDKFLKVSRIIKRRTVANEACDAGRVAVNGKVVRASYDVKVGDVIATKETDSTKIKGLVEAMGDHIAPKWLDIDKNAGVAKVIAMPERDDIDFEFNEQLIIELYSK